MSPPESAVLSEPYAGLQAQALGLAEAAGLAPRVLALHPRFPLGALPAAWWPAPGWTVRMDAAPAPLLVTAGGAAGIVGRSFRRRGQARVVQVQNPRVALRDFDLVVANVHDEITGPNVVVIRTALHRATPARLAEARVAWAPRFAHLGRPLVSVLVGGSNGRMRLGPAEGAALAGQLAAVARRDGAGVAVTPSRRTGAEVVTVLRQALAPLGGWVWDGSGENPYFGLLACADAIVVTADSISMVSEACATAAPVLVAGLPGRSRRIGLFLDVLRREGRVRDFAGRLEHWAAAPLDDTPLAAAAMRRRLGL